MTVYDVVIIGSGAAGGTLAKELSAKNKKVLVLEKGDFVEEAEAYKTYDIAFSGIEIWRIIAVGGTTLVTFGNAMPVLTNELRDFGINIVEEIKELNNELNISPLPSSFIGNATKSFIEAAKNLGLTVKFMPKMIDPKKCLTTCKHCTAGCITGAKWSSLKAIRKALASGAKIITKVSKVKILTSGGKVKGVKYIVNGVEKEVTTDVVVSCAGALGTPEILFSSGIEDDVGEGLFTDVFITIGGIVKNVMLNREQDMLAYVKLGHGILSPFFSIFLRPKFMCKGIKASPKDIMGIMVKIADTPSGKVYRNGKVSKPLTDYDIELLRKYSEKALEMLEAMGADMKTIVATYPRGVHPGGTAAIGKVVDKNLETEIKGLYVADASVLPKAPGAPPMLTIMALAKYLAKKLVET
ncbi:MAG: ferredoxin [Thermoprotei archaeon]|nr:MAG: ferredoxin [Thermoprotei archaeon]